MSLLDMMNFSYFSFSTAVQIAIQDMAHALFMASKTEESPVPTDGTRERIRNNIDYLARKCGELLLERADARIGRISMMLQTNYSYSELAGELQILLQAIEDDIQLEMFFHYRRDKGMIVLRLPGEWGVTLAAFPSLTKEIEEGVDCYALEHNTACVFHMMRVAEMGMRSLARERGVKFADRPLEWANWQPILEQIESRARTATKGMSIGPGRDAALAFYGGAIGQLHGFKDTFRNVTMHVRKRYDELEALRSINQVRDFMNGLSAKIGENTRRPIPLSRWP